MTTNTVHTAEYGMMTEQALQARLNALEREVGTLEERIKALTQEDRISIICFSGEWDRLFAALSVAVGALAMGMEVHLFFTFWSVAALPRAEGRQGHTRSFLQAIFGWMLPRGARRAPLSRFNFWGLGKAMIRRVMRQEGVDDIDALFDEARDLGAHFHLCNTTAGLFGLRCEELGTGQSVNQCGVATFLSYAMKSKIVLFV